MNTEIKFIIQFYSIALVCLSISSFGIYLTKPILSISILSTVVTIIPIMALLTVLYKIRK